MAKTNRDFAPEFKRRAVALLEGSGWLLMEAAQLKISPSAPRKRRTVVHGGTAPSRASSKVTLVSSALMASPADQAAEIARPRRELDRTRMKRSLSKKSHRVLAEVPSGAGTENGPSGLTLKSGAHRLDIPHRHVRVRPS